MPLISTKLHGAGDYATGSLLLAAPTLLPFADRPATTLLQASGAATLSGSAVTDYELGIARLIPMPLHLIGDAAGGAAMLAAAWGLRRRGSKIGSWLPVALLGVGQIAGAALTKRVPGDRGPSGPPGAPATAGTPATAAPAAPAAPATAAAATAAAATAGAPAGAPATTTAPATAGTPADDPLVAEAEAAAAAEAASIGGHVTPEVADPAMEPVYEAGGGEEEGFEAAEAELIENATNFDNARSPRRDAITPEAEADRATAVYGEGDRERSSETADEASPGSPQD